MILWNEENEFIGGFDKAKKVRDRLTQELQYQEKVLEDLKERLKAVNRVIKEGK